MTRTLTGGPAAVGMAARSAPTPDVLRDLQAGKLEQACSACGRWEAAGFNCSGCGRPMSQVEWYRNGDMARRNAARDAAGKPGRTPVKRAVGRPRRHVAFDGTLGLL